MDGLPLPQHDNDINMLFVNVRGLPTQQVDADINILLFVSVSSLPAANTQQQQYHEYTLCLCISKGIWMN